MKKSIFILIICLLANTLQAQYTLHNDAFYTNSDDCDCITITPESNFSSGAFWHNSALNLNESFEIVIEPKFGCNTDGAQGGDGIAFVLQSEGVNQPPTGNGGNIGYNGMAPSLAIQFDTYRDNPIDFPFTNDPGGGFFPYYDHIGLMLNGSCNHLSANDLFTGAFSPSFTDVEDCAAYDSHQLTLNWDAAAMNLQLIYCNNVEGCFTIFNENIDISATVFSGNSSVYWGFTGATGGANNEQEVCINYFDKEPFITDTIVCYADNLVYDFSCINNFSFEWSDINGNIISNTPVFDIITTENATYNVTLNNDLTGRTYYESFDVVVLNPELEEDLALHIDNDCYGYNDGQLGVNYVDAILPVNYYVNNGVSQANSTFINLFANTYEVVATDGYGCADTVNVIINEEPELILTVDNITGVVCNTTNTGAIDVTPSGGVGGYSFFWLDENGSVYNTEDLSSISDGYYDYTLTDANNCESSGQILVEQINSIDIDTLTLSNIDCFEFSTGEISVLPTGGLAPFDYSWDGPNSFTSTQNAISNLMAGQYTLTLTDDDNCYKVYPFDLSQGSALTFNIDTTIDANCVYSADGIVSLSHSGGTGTTTAFIFDDNNTFVSNSSNFSSLTVGDYYAYAEDDLGCVSYSSTFSIGSPSDMIITPLDIDDVECFGGDEGKIQVTIDGGTLPYNGFSWSGPNGFTSNQINIYSLEAGGYTLTATDDNGCIKQESYTINEPSDISINASSIEYVKCTGDNSGAISVNIVGGTPPYNSYSWVGPNGFTSNQENAITDLYEGEYTLSIEDDFECEQVNTFTVFEPDSLLQFDLSSTPSCLIENIGQAVIDISGGVQPYIIDWFGNDPMSLAYGQQFVRVIDNANCAITDSFIVDLFPQPIAEFYVDSILKLNTPVSLSNYSSDEVSWYWDFGNETFSVLEEPSPIYNAEDVLSIHLQVSNEFGCSDTTSQKVRVVNSLIAYIPNTFSPNGDMKNDMLTLSILNELEFEAKIYNRYGTLLFSTKDKNVGWDGTYNGESVQTGTYIYTLFAVDVFGKVYNRKKTINLIR